LENSRQFRKDVGVRMFCICVTLVPWIPSAGEMKTSRAAFGEGTVDWDSTRYLVAGAIAYHLV